MLDFSVVWSGEKSFADLTHDLTIDDLHALTDEMVDRVLTLTAQLRDADVVFVPQDPKFKPREGMPAEENQPWTLGQVIAHVTFESEEAATWATMLARGNTFNPNSYNDLGDMRPIRTVELLHARIHESRRMRHALLNAWPDAPRFDVTVQFPARIGEINAKGMFVFGLFHANSHLNQIQSIIQQAQAELHVA